MLDFRADMRLTGPVVRWLYCGLEWNHRSTDHRLQCYRVPDWLLQLTAVRRSCCSYRKLQRARNNVSCVICQ